MYDEVSDGDLDALLLMKVWNLSCEETLWNNQDLFSSFIAALILFMFLVPATAFLQKKENFICPVII